MSSKNSSSPGSVAILGGDGRQVRKRPAGADVRYYQARGYGGNGELRSLLAALTAGSIDSKRCVNPT